MEMSLNCPCCGESEQVTEWPDVGLMRCGKCLHLWQKNIQPFQYGAEYVKGYAGRPTFELSWVRLGYLYLFRQHGTILDIGYGDGEFIRQASKAGYCAIGYDTHGDDVGVPVIKELSQGFDIVTMFDSFEHLPDLTLPFKVKPKLFVVTVPYFKEWWGPDEVKASRHYKPNEHLHYFSPRSIETIFNAHGYFIASRAPVEDIIRKNENAKPNTMTYIFLSEVQNAD